MLEIAYSVAGEKIEEAIYKPSKIERGKAVDALREEVTNAILEKYEDATEFAIDQAFDFMQKKAFRKSILEKGIRADGRQVDELRPLSAEANLMPRSHGSALFARGETQALGLCTLAPADEAQYIDAYTGGEEEKAFFYTIIFHHFQLVKPEEWVDLIEEKSDTELLPNAPSNQHFRVRMTSHTLSE